MTLELERERPPRVCRICGEPTDAVCARCGVDKETGDLVQPPVMPVNPIRDADAPLRKRAAALLAVPKSTREWLRRGLRESLRGWPGTLLCLAVATLALSIQRIGSGDALIPWPGQLLASFMLTFLTIEHARGAHEGSNAGIETRGAFDPSALGPSLLMSLLLLPLYVGPWMSTPWVTALAAVPLVLVFPAFLGALVTDSLQELGLSRLKQAVVDSPRYLATTAVAMTCLIGGLAAVWLPSEQSALWRAPLGVLGATLAGSFCGLMRRDAETQVDDES